MVKGKDGKMVPDYAADGKGKMKAGGMAKAYNEGGGVMEDDAAKKQADADAKTRAKARAALKTTVETFSNLVTGKGGSKSKKPRRAIEAPMSKAEKLKKNKEQAYKQAKKIYEAEESLPEGSISKKIVGATDKIGDKIRGSSVGKLAKKMGTGTFSRDDEAQMKARKEVKGYKKGGKIRGYGMARGGKVCKMR